jgi:hypothetical protein
MMNMPMMAFGCRTMSNDEPHSDEEVKKAR